MILPEDFYSDSHSLIFDAMLELYKFNKPIDLITVREKLADKGHLEKIGGITYLSELVEIVPTSANIYEYTQIVKNKSVHRKLIK
jgi:replicative DNA helicase